MTDKDKKDEKDESAAVNEARQADKDRPEEEKDAVAANPHRDNVNPNAYSEESAREPGDIETYSINEPGPDAPQPFKVPEDHTATTTETLEQAYPDGYVAPEPPEPPEQDARQDLESARADQADEADVSGTIGDISDPSDPSDPDDLEDELDQAEEEGDFKPTHRSHKPSSSKKRK